MTSSDGSCYWTVCSLLLLSLVLVGCSHHDGIPTSEVASSPDQHLPFDASSDKGGIFPTGALIATAIPAGTPLAVRLRSSLSSATSRAGDSFEAIPDEPTDSRKSIAPRGSVVSGKVLDAKAASALQEPGYMRLALTSVSLQGQPVAIQTSSIFVKRNLRRERNPITLAGARISGGHRRNFAGWSIARRDVGVRNTHRGRVHHGSVDRHGIHPQFGR